MQISSSAGGLNDVTVSYNPVYNTTIATWVNASTKLPESAVSTNDGISWGATTPIGSSQAASLDVFTATDPVTGITVATWTDSTSHLPFYSLSEDGGKTWSTPAQIGSQTVTGTTDVFVSLDPSSHTFIATWNSGNPWFSLFGISPPTPTPSPVGILANQGGNAQRLAVYLNSLASSFPQLIAPLRSLSAGQLKDALIAILPKPTTRLAAANTVLVMNDAMVHRLTEKTAMRLMQNEEFSVSELYENRTLFACNNYAAVLPRGSSQTAAREEDHFAVWADGFGEFAHQKAQDQLPSFDTTTGGAFAGFDYYTANGQLSTAFSYARSHVKSSMENDHIDFYGLALYGIGYIGDAFIEAGVWNVYNRYHEKRTISFPGFNQQARANYNGWQVAPHLRVGYDFVCGSQWILEPFAEADCSFVFQHGFSEHGSLYDMKQKSAWAELLQASGGLNTYLWQTKDWGDWFFRVSLAYTYKKGFDLGTLSHEAIVAAPPGFSVFAYGRAQNLFSPGAEIFFRGNNDIFGSINYDGQFGSAYRANSIFGKIGIFF